jgi:hypothetical protein
MGGVGKTQLALRAAEILGPDFADGVYFVPLAGLTSHVELLPTLAHALAVTEPGEIQDTLVETLDRNILLILDNFEHISKAALLIGEDSRYIAWAAKLGGRVGISGGWYAARLRDRKRICTLCPSCVAI